MTQRSDLAGQIWPHLQADRPTPREQPRQRNPQAERLYPALAPPKPKPFDRNREILLKNLREINARHKR
jgi:hypothetical protein